MDAAPRAAGAWTPSPVAGLGLFLRQLASRRSWRRSRCRRPARSLGKRHRQPGDNTNEALGCSTRGHLRSARCCPFLTFQLTARYHPCFGLIQRHNGFSSRCDGRFSRMGAERTKASGNKVGNHPLLVYVPPYPPELFGVGRYPIRFALVLHREKRTVTLIEQ